MKIRDVYRPAVVTCAGSDSLRAASQRMVEADTGVLVVLDGDAMVGLLTERDVVRAVAGAQSRRRGGECTCHQAGDYDKS